MARETEVDARDAYVRGIGPARQQRGDVVVHERDHELVDIEESQPVDRGPEETQGVGIGVDLATRQGPVQQRHQTVVEPRLDDFVQLVGAAVVVDEEMPHPESVVIGQPLGQVGRFVADDDDDAELQARRRQQGSLADDVGRRRPLLPAAG